jgi:hypothetical protein
MDAKNWDSEGDSHERDTTEWTELYLAKRPENEPRVDIGPICKNPLILEIESEDPVLALESALFLAITTKGLIEDWKGNFVPYADFQGQLASGWQVRLESAMSAVNTSGACNGP